jgi:hypothetical protein
MQAILLDGMDYRLGSGKIKGKMKLFRSTHLGPSTVAILVLVASVW